MNTQNIPASWIEWSKKGRHKGSKKRNAVLKCLKNGKVRGYFSDLLLSPNLNYRRSMYPSFEHLVDRTNHKDAAVEARVFNDMKSHLNEKEFWSVIEHLFFVGCEKGKIKSSRGKRLKEGWSPEKHY